MEPGFFIEVAGAAIEHRAKLLAPFRKLWNRLQHGDVQIVVYGSGGVGKSTLGRFLASPTSIDAVSIDYKLSDLTEKYDAPSDLWGKLTIAPGQPEYRKDSFPPLHRKVTSGGARGIVHVVSYGMHAIPGREPLDKHTSWQPNDTHESFAARFAAKQRDAELDVLRELVSVLTTAEGPLWMVTVGTKQDLWWSQRHDVNEWYCGKQSAYRALVDEIAKKHGTEHFKHRFVSGALVYGNLRSPTGEVLFPTSAGYEQSIRAANLARIVEVITGLATTEREQ
jgi:hypothetical protein